MLSQQRRQIVLLGGSKERRLDLCMTDWRDLQAFLRQPAEPIDEPLPLDPVPSET